MFKMLMLLKISRRLSAFIGRFAVLRANVKMFAGGSQLITGIMGAVITVIVCTLMSTEVLPVLINGSDGGIGETVLPIAQASLLIGGIFGGISILYVVAKHSFSSK
jgi:hypothetical protein